MTRRYTLDELRIGMRVTYDKLRDILDTYIILSDVEGVASGLTGTVAYITPERDKRSDELLFSGKYGICRCVYNPSEEYIEE